MLHNKRLSNRYVSGNSYPASHYIKHVIHDKCYIIKDYQTKIDLILDTTELSIFYFPATHYLFIQHQSCVANNLQKGKKKLQISWYNFEYKH